MYSQKNIKLNNGIYFINIKFLRLEEDSILYSCSRHINLYSCKAISTVNNTILF